MTFVFSVVSVRSTSSSSSCSVPVSSVVMPSVSVAGSSVSVSSVSAPIHTSNVSGSTIFFSDAPTFNVCSSISSDNGSTSVITTVFSGSFAAFACAAYIVRPETSIDVTAISPAMKIPSACFPLFRFSKCLLLPTACFSILYTLLIPAVS